MFEHNKTPGIFCVLHTLLTHFNRRSQYIMRNFILWQWKKLPFAKHFCSHLQGSFQNIREQMFTHT